MSIFLCRAVVAKGQPKQSAPKTEMEIEQDYICAQVDAPAREARRQRVVRLIAPVTAFWTRTVESLTLPARKAQQQKDLLERLGSMPPYMLDDIGVVRDDVGRFCYHDDYGRLAEVAPVEPKRAAPRRVRFGSPVAVRMALYPAA